MMVALVVMGEAAEIERGEEKRREILVELE